MTRPTATALTSAGSGLRLAAADFFERRVSACQAGVTGTVAFDVEF